MKNSELIKQLQKYSPDYEVGFYRYSAMVSGRLLFQPIISITNDIENKNRIGIEFGQPVLVEQ